MQFIACMLIWITASIDVEYICLWRKGGKGKRVEVANEIVALCIIRLCGVKLVHTCSSNECEWRERRSCSRWSVRCSLTNLTAFVSSCRILPLERTLSVQRSMSSWPDGISLPRALTWFVSHPRRNGPVPWEKQCWDLSWSRPDSSSGSDDTIARWLVESRCRHTRRRTRSLILEARKSPAIFKPRLAAQRDAFHVFMATFLPPPSRTTVSFRMAQQNTLPCFHSPAFLLFYSKFPILVFVKFKTLHCNSDKPIREKLTY